MPLAPYPRPHYDWRLRTRTLPLGQRTVIMGILNVTPDSFSDGGLFYSVEQAPERALAHALALLDQGANILDIGGESTRPGAIPLSPGEEQTRILPVIEAVLRERPGTIVSVDTFHAATARHAILAGAEIVNDVSGHLWDPAMASTCAELAVGDVLMHTRGRPQEWKDLPPLAPTEVLPLVLAGLKERIDAATAAGIARERIVLDPGFGFGKRMAENYPLLAGLAELHALGLPLMIGLSRKSFLGKHAAGHATTAGNTAAILAGAHILRVHDVAAAVEAAFVADQVMTIR